jgi:flavin reductase (DIM6/NTAB) family NADH-FMN oxidoreductase RutF
MSGFSLRDLSKQDRYKLLSGIVIPRPIALVTTLDANGAVNAGPFSFFNVFSEDPPLVALGLQHKADRTPKDTTRNIHRDGEFVVNMVDEALASAMNDCAVDFPSGESEVAALGLAVSPSVDVKVPRLAAAPFALECKRSVSLAFGPTASYWWARCCAFMRAKVLLMLPTCMSISQPTGRSAACSAISTRINASRL